LGQGKPSGAALCSKDKTQLKYNEFLTLSGIPPEVYVTVSEIAARWSGSSTKFVSQATNAPAS